MSVEHIEEKRCLSRLKAASSSNRNTNERQQIKKKPMCHPQRGGKKIGEREIAFSVTNRKGGSRKRGELYNAFKFWSRERSKSRALLMDEYTMVLRKIWSSNVGGEKEGEVAANKRLEELGGRG